MEAPKRVNRGWMLNRLRKLPEAPTTSEVLKTLKISSATVHRWLADRYFQSNQIAVKGSNQWVFDRERLRLWIVAVMGLSESDYMRAKSEQVSSNPPEEGDVSVEEAREMLGLPDGYSVVHHRVMGADDERDE